MQQPVRGKCVRSNHQRFCVKHMASRLRPRRPSPILAILLIGGIFLFSSPIRGLSVTVVNVSDYPWLVPGAYASYMYFTIGGPPTHVTANGTVLLDEPQPKKPDGTSLPAPTGSANLTWTVLNRSGGMASLNVTFESEGCEYSLLEANDLQPCTQFAFQKSIIVAVNVTSEESYVNGQSQGRVNFWAPPLLIQGQLFLGSMFVDGSRIDNLGNVSVSRATNFGGPPINASGETVPPPYYTYSFTPAGYGYGSTHMYAWLNSSGVAYNGNTEITTFPVLNPSYYDYYNGLALYFEGPEYPIQQTVCNINGGNTSDCKYVTLGTTLGQYFFTGKASFLLHSTNIPLTPIENQSQPESSYGFVYFVAPIVSVVAGAIALMLVLRKARKPTV